MKSHQKRLVREWQNDLATSPKHRGVNPPKRLGVVHGDGNISNCAKRVCWLCQREFSNGRALGGHIRIHNREQRNLSPARGDNTNTNTRTHNNRRIDEAAARAARAKARARRFNSGNGGANGNESNNEAIDFSQNLSWKVHKKRGSNNNNNNDRENKKAEIVVVCKCMEDEEEWEEGDDEGHSSMTERLERIGISCTAHPIIMTRRRFLCTICDHYMLTFHSVCCHVHEAHSNSADDEQPPPPPHDDEVEKDGEGGGGEQDNEHVDKDKSGEDNEEESAKVEEEQRVDHQLRDDNQVVTESAECVTTMEVADEVSADMNQNVVMASSNPSKRRRNFDLNELPPHEEEKQD